METKRVDTVYGTYHAWAVDVLTQQLEEYSAHTRNELAMIRSFIREGDNLIDVGGHIGTFAIPFARFNGGRGKVFSFEANPATYDLLARNIAENSLEGVIVPIRAIVSEKPQRFRMVVPGTALDQICYVPDPDGPDGGTVNLDEWLQHEQNDPPIHFIKTDTEGAELSVLQSCRRIIERDRPIIYTEVARGSLARFGTTPEDLADFLQPFGYHFFRNVGARNSDNDQFQISRVWRMADEGDFFDVLAIHPSSPRYPRRYSGRLWRLEQTVKSLIGPIVRKLRGGSRHE